MIEQCESVCCLTVYVIFMRVLCTLLRFVFIRNYRCEVRTALRDKLLRVVKKNITETTEMINNAYGDEVYNGMTI